MMNKKGQSGIISVVLILLLVLVAIVIVWNAVNIVVKSSSNKVDIDPFSSTIKIDSLKVYINNGQKKLEIKVTLSPEGNITSLKSIVNYQDGSIESFNTPGGLKGLETKEIILDVSNSKEISKVTVVPILPNNKSGIETNENNIVNTGCVPYCTNKQCGSDQCGGSCGTCSGATPQCNSNGRCVECLENSHCTVPPNTACSNEICVCAPKTCTDYGYLCGNWDDGCGSPISCGPCSGATPKCNFNGKCVECLDNNDCTAPKTCSVGTCSSCPYVYSWNGIKYILDSEALSVSMMPEFEREYYSRLPNLKPVQSDKGFDYKIIISEELDETTYLNSIKLFEVINKENYEIYHNSNNELHTIKDKILPIKCIDKKGNDCLSIINSIDSKFWNNKIDFDLINITDKDNDKLADNSDFESFRNYIILTFEKKSDLAKLLIVTKEFDTQDKSWIWFYSQLVRNNNIDVKGITEMFARENFLRIYLFNGTGFEYNSLIDESSAREVPARIVKVINLSNINSDNFTIMLEGIPGFVGIDYLSVDFSKDSDLIYNEIPLISAIKDNISVIDNLNNDNKYITIKSGKKIEFVFRSNFSDKNATYFLLPKGYYLPDLNYNLFGKQEFVDSEKIEKALYEPYYEPRYLLPRFKEQYF